MAMVLAETIREIHVDTRFSGCYLKGTSSFHMNLPGINIPSDKELYVTVSDFRLPIIEKSLTFWMYYGFDFVKIDNNSVKEYTFVFSSLAQFAAQLRCAVMNDFIYKKKCLVNEGDRNTEEFREMSGEFHVKYENGMFELQLDENCVIFASTNLFQFMAFYSEVDSAMNGKEDNVLAASGNVGVMKVCKRLIHGAPKKFFSDVDGVCHLAIENAVSPVTCFDGGRYSVVCSYDLKAEKLVSNYRKFDGVGMRNISFCLLNNDFKPFDFGCCLKTQSLRFVLNVVKKL